MKRLLAFGLAVVLCISMLGMAFAGSIWSLSGNLDNYGYTFSLSGDTQNLYAQTTYGDRTVVSKAKVIGTYIGADFTGTKTTSSEISGIPYALAYIFVTGDNRFVKASGVYTIKGFTYSSDDFKVK